MQQRGRHVSATMWVACPNSCLRVFASKALPRSMLHSW